MDLTINKSLTLGGGPNTKILISQGLNIVCLYVRADFLDYLRQYGFGSYERQRNDRPVTCVSEAGKGLYTAVNRR